ncbi:MAG: hypothetical protein AAGF10_01965 [Verrucomicrobiota bacterium]
MSGFCLVSEAVELSTPTLPLAGIKPGMQGEWKTVIQGTEVETFRFEVLGTARNFIGPERDVIIAKALDESQILSGPVGGMSGSPCFIDGKLIGAYAYGYTWPKEQAIIGITPIADMLETFEKEKHRKSDEARASPEASAPAGQASAQWQAQSGQAQLATLDLETVLQPLPTPLAISGFSARTLNAFAEEMAQRGLEPVQAPIGFTTELTSASIETASPVAGVLMSGDFSIAGVGTVTWREGDQVLAFGHPFFGFGDEEMPMAPAEIITVIQSVARSFKLSNVGPIVGTIYQDRLTAIAGEIGQMPRTTQVSYTLRSPGEVERTFTGELYRNKRFSPLFAAMGLMESMLFTMESGDEQTFYTTVTLHLEDYEPIVLEQVGSGPGAATGVAMQLMRAYGQLVDNPFASAEVTHIEADIRTVDSWILGGLHGIQNLSGNLHPGDLMHLAITVNNFQEERTRHRVSIPIPEGTSGEELLIFVGDAGAAERLEREQVAATIDSLDGIVDYLRKSRSNNNLYVKVLQRAQGLNLNGQRLDALPLSVRNLLSSRESPTMMTENRYISLWETEISMPGRFDGQYTLTTRIE